MKVLIIEDEAPAFRRLQKILEEVVADLEILEVLDSVSESVKWLQNHALPDLIFMDIQLSDGVSFQIFDQVKVTSPVIFTTAFDEYTLRAFKVNSIDYLLKPIKKEELTYSIKKYRELNSDDKGTPDLNQLIRQIKLEDKQYKSRFLIRQGDTLFSLETKQIAYFKVHHGVVYLVTTESKRHVIDFSLDDLSRLLDPHDFFRANRQFIVHFQCIAQVHRYHKGKLLLETRPADQEQIIISAEKAADFKGWLADDKI